jgi:RND superfamily putative drug exporter
VLLLLLLTFRTIIAAAVPLVLGAASVVTALAAIYLIGSRTDVSIFALNVASMIGLGLGIDFSLIVVNRFREELARGRDPETAVMVTMATAGRSITYSGVTVLLGMLIMTLMLNLMAIRSISLGVALVAVSAVIGGLTLLPALLGVLAQRIEWLRVIPQRKRPVPEQQRFWYRLSHAIMGRPWAWLLVSMVILLAIAFPARELRLVGASPGLLPQKSESVKGTQLLDKEFGSNLLTPIQVVLRTKEANGIWNPDVLTQLDQLTNTLKNDPRTANVTSLATYEAAEPRDGRYQHITPFDFMPAPAVDPLDPDPDPPGIGIEHKMSVWVDSVPYNPAYFGFADFKFAAGTNQQLSVAPTLQVYLIQSGALTVQAGGAVSLTRAADFGQRDKAQSVADGSPLT